MDQVRLSVGLNTDACDSPLQSTVTGDFWSRTWEAAEFDEDEHRAMRTRLLRIMVTLQMSLSQEPSGSHLWHRSCIRASCKAARLHWISHRVKMIRDGAGHFPSGTRGAGSPQG